jgi:flagellar biosynthesis/type III secretory pathway M-ring protein FliF/YscJ
MAATNPALENLRNIAKNDPATVANVVKAWVGDAKAA